MNAKDIKAVGLEVGHNSDRTIEILVVDSKGNGSCIRFGKERLRPYPYSIHDYYERSTIICGMLSGVYKLMSP